MAQKRYKGGGHRRLTRRGISITCRGGKLVDDDQTAESDDSIFSARQY